MRKYPSSLRASRLKYLLESLRIEANHHLVANNDCRSGTALIFPDQISDSRVVARNVSYFKIDSSLREEGLSNTARRSTWLAEHNHLVFLHIYWILTMLEWSLKNRKWHDRGADFPHRRLSVCGSVWISTLKSSGEACLKRISRAVEMSWTRESDRSSGNVT